MAAESRPVPPRPKPRRVLLLTPATRFGSWAWLEKVIAASPEHVRWTVVSYGRPDKAIQRVRFVSLPGLDYARLGLTMSQPRLLFLNVLYYLPLVPIAWVTGLLIRPHVLLGNGLMAGAVLAPLRLTGGRLYIAFHAYIGHAGGLWRKMVRSLLRQVATAFVNSDTSFDDLAALMDERRIVKVPHWADERFFAIDPIRERGERLRVLFVGRLDREKFAQCLRVCERLAVEGLTELCAVGTGALQNTVQHPAIEFAGYLDDLNALAERYARADVVWAPADVTYLSLPGVEAIAAGCPVVVSDVPAVEVRAQAGLRIPRSLVVPDIGWVVDGIDDTEVEDLLRKLAADGIPIAMRQHCRAYALRHHSPDSSLRVVVDRVAQ